MLNTSQDSFGPRMITKKLSISDCAEKQQDQNECSPDERNQCSSSSTCNSSLEKETPTYNKLQASKHNEFYNQICNQQPLQQTQPQIISDEDLQSIYQNEEVVEEGVLKQQFSIQFNNFDTKEKAISFLNSWQSVKVNTNDEPRTNDAHKEGVSTLRSVAKDVIKQIGRKILSGDFSLSTVSFPIRGKLF